MAFRGADKRRDKRLGLQLPVRFSTGPDDSIFLPEGLTHNVSSGGVYFEAPADQVAPGESLWVRITIPAHPAGHKPNLTLVGSGIVLRVERLEKAQIKGTWPKSIIERGLCGIALKFEQRPTIQLRSFEDLLWEDSEDQEGA